MFSGIIQAVGNVIKVVQHAQDRALTCQAPSSFLTGMGVGDSIAVNGTCLTLTSCTQETFSVDLSTETLARTYFSEICAGDKVNLEKAMTLQTPLNGHLVMGHVDGIGKVTAQTTNGRSTVFEITIPDPLIRYMAEKGSVCLDGVSLTVNRLTQCGIMVNCIPQTLTQTILNAWRVGSKVHIEVDIIARYVERLHHEHQ